METLEFRVKRSELNEDIFPCLRALFKERVPASKEVISYNLIPCEFSTDYVVVANLIDRKLI